MRDNNNDNLLSNNKILHHIWSILFHIRGKSKRAYDLSHLLNHFLLIRPNCDDDHNEKYLKGRIYFVQYYHLSIVFLSYSSFLTLFRTFLVNMKWERRKYHHVLNTKSANKWVESNISKGKYPRRNKKVRSENWTKKSEGSCRFPD